MNSQQAFLVFQAIKRYASAVGEQTRISLDHGRTKRERRHLQEAQAIAHREVKDALRNLLDRIGWGEKDDRERKMDLLLAKYDASLIRSHLGEPVFEDLNELRRQLKELL